MGIIVFPSAVRTDNVIADCGRRQAVWAHLCRTYLGSMQVQCQSCHGILAGSERELSGLVGLVDRLLGARILLQRRKCPMESQLQYSGVYSDLFFFSVLPICGGVAAS